MKGNREAELWQHVLLLLAMVRDARELLNDHPNFALRRDPSVTSYKLAARMDAYLKEAPDAQG